MKNRNKMLVAVMLVLACFALVPHAPAACLDGCNNTFFNVWQGDDALSADLAGPGVGNSAFGWRALFTDTTGNFNTGIGGGALVLNNADSNTAVGAAALLLNTTATQSVAVGTDALVFSNADDNTAVGFQALEFNVAAVTNAALGVFAGQNNDSSGSGFANFNTAVGGFALQANVDGTRNTAVGAGAMESANGGNDNTAVGELAGNILGAGSGNICIGSGAGTVAPGSGEYNNTILLGITGDDNANTPNGRTYIANIIGVTPGSGGTQNVIVDEDGQLGSVVSSRRFKKDIKPMDQTSEALLALKPVTFHYKGGDTKKAKETAQFGLIAEDVEQVDRDLVIYDKKGELLSVRYDAVNVMLLNEFLKEHKKVEDQQASISQLKSEMRTMVAQLKEQAAQIQKVSAQLEVSKPAAKVVVNKQ